VADLSVNAIDESLPSPQTAHVSTQPQAAVEAWPRHLVRLPGTRWALWRTIAIRGAGFPAALVDALAAPSASSAADAYLEMRERASSCRGPVLRRIAADMRIASADDRRRLKDLKRSVLAGKAIDPADGEDACAAAAASAETARAADAYRAAFEHETAIVNERLEGFSRDPLFREAMLWQGAEGTRRIWDSLRPGSRPRYRRRALQQMAMRVQRYCVKNDAIGFFGPFGWASFDEGAARIVLEPGAGLTASREVFFEDWCIHTLAGSLASTYDLRPWLAPRIKVGVWIHGARAYRPLRKPLALSAPELAVVSLCDGERTARAIAEAVLTKSNPGVPAGEGGVFEILERLAAGDVVAWCLDVAPQTYPERELRERLAKIGDPALRDPCIAALDEIVHARDGVAASAGNAEQLDTALTALEECFTRLTAQPSSRRGGQTYAGRTLVYEDCRRDCELRIGAPLLEEIAAPLGIVLDATQWGAAEACQVLRTHLRVRLAELRAQEGPEVDCHQFMSYVMSVVWLAQEGRAPLFEPLVARFRQKWEQVLGHPLEASASCVTYAVDEVRARARDAFPARDPGWSLGRYISPDVLIAADGASAIRRGDYAAVLGEVHVGNTLEAATYITQHQDPRELFEAATWDTRGEIVVQRAFPRPAWIARVNRGLILPRYWRYLFGDDAPCHPPCRELPAGKLVAVEHGDTVVARARDGRVELDIVVGLGD
jgi:hypothetical protein